MASSVRYRFQNQNGSAVITFDGPSITLDKLKREIMRVNFTRDTDSDLKIFNEENNEEYSLSQPVYRNSSIIVKRVPREAGVAPILDDHEESFTAQVPLTEDERLRAIKEKAGRDYETTCDHDQLASNPCSRFCQTYLLAAWRRLMRCPCLAVFSIQRSSLCVVDQASRTFAAIARPEGSIFTTNAPCSMYAPVR
ncbi:uncharacterized protein MONBRDRAFT_5439 [Monosiga brevicollis MX1]|uniref:DWNN domain-containing protein n=1 Tax=Monosiga brevicollis TaxID=81824 RepID=A9UQZ7_MONBE|nr:uncharacterized protein MONBRDRAFT_5439 [Monosiga brevicollis MX1]EDQ92686.1 predicted protein [Monosiga brevicollis MX1]|eukprot:XP_001742448.1 hypothetical protein [Monosiga brevicollis MX1]